MTGRAWRRIGIIAGVIVALEVVCRVGLVKPTDLVPPSLMVRGMVIALSQPATLNDVALTLSSVAISVFFAAVLGVGIGIVLHGMPRVRRACEPFIASYYALPLFALYPVLVVIFGVGATPIIVTGVLYAAMSVLIGTLSGLDHIPRVFRKSAKVHRLGHLGTVFRIYIPASAAEILGGVTLGVSYAFVAVIASEFLLAPDGLGHAIADAYTTFKIERMYGLMLALLLLVLLINTGLRAIRAHFSVNQHV